MRPEIYSYLNFRQYLQDLTKGLKKASRFNLRAFAQKAGIKAPGYLKMVIDGRRNLTAETTEKFCRALDITDRARIYFLKLVLYNQSKDPDLKKTYFAELIALRPRSAEFKKETFANRYFSKPYYVCIREMVTLKDFREDYKWMARRCFPRISPSEAKEAVKTLIELGLLKRDTSNALVQTEDFIRADDINTQAVEAYHFHEAMLDKARHALARLDQHERNYYSLTLPLPKEMFAEIIQDFYEFRERIVKKVAKRQKDFDEVYQLNFQLFPATKKGDQSS